MSEVTLRYRAPEGQDRVAVSTALRQAGYDPQPDETDHQLIHLTCAEEDRERVRETIGAVRVTALDTGVARDPGPVRFGDET